MGELLARVSSKELAEWRAYYRVEPWGEWRADLRNGITASVIANVNRGRGKRVFKASDFVLNFNRKTAADNLSGEVIAAFRRYGSDGGN